MSSYPRYMKKNYSATCWIVTYLYMLGVVSIEAENL